MRSAPFLPTTRREMEELGWKELDVLLVTGDAYVDHPSFGTAVIGRWLESLGYRTGILPQPDPDSPDSFLEMGVPALFAGVSSGAMDSMVNRYTSLGRLRSDDAYSEGGDPGRRPDRALLRYVNAVQRAMKGTPVIIGGIEASLRRISHYDFWSDRVRKSVLLDTKADLLVYGMGERAVAEAASRLSSGGDLSGIRGTARFAHRGALTGVTDAVVLPAHEEVTGSPGAFMEMTRIVEAESNPWSGRRLVQQADDRVVILEPPALPLTTGEMDRVYGLPFAGAPHPRYARGVPAFDMIGCSITAVRGCAGGCSFCALGLHQGRMISSRSRESIVSETARIAGAERFRGTVTDVGGPTANMYGLGCGSPEAMSACRRVSCLYPEVCPHFRTDQSAFAAVLDAASGVEGVRHVFVSSGIRHDLACLDRDSMRSLVARHVSGHLKIAPEHFAPAVLRLMRKCGPEEWDRFLGLFDLYTSEAGKEQYVLPYVIAAFPGCTMDHMRTAAAELRRRHMRPQQVQVFLPTPMTMATAVWFTGMDPWTGERLFVERRPSGRKKQLEAIPGIRAGGRG